MMPEVMRSAEIGAPPDVVWKWFSTRDALRTWWGVSDLEIDLVVGGEYTMRGRDGETTITGRVLEFAPERRLVLSWFEEDSAWVHPARLLFLIEPVPGGSRVTVQHDGFAGIGAADWQRIQGAYERGIVEHALLDRLSDLVLDDAA